MNSYKTTSAMMPVHRHEVSTKSVGSSRRGHKRESCGPEHADGSVSTDRPTVSKKPRTQKQCYPGGHIEVWHKSSGVSQPGEAFHGTPSHAKATTEHPAAQELQSYTDPAPPDKGLSTTQETPASGSAIVPAYGGWPSFGPNYLGECLPEPVIPLSGQDPVGLFQSSPPATDLGLSTCTTPFTTFPNTALENWPEIRPETLSFPETWTYGSLDAGPQTQGLTCTGLESYSNPLTQSLEDPTSYLGGFPCPDFYYFPWAPSDYLTMGGGDRFPASHQAVPPEVPVFKSEQDYEEASLHRGPTPMQQPEPTTIPDYPLWTDTEIPVQSCSQQTLNDYTPPSPCLGQDGICPDEGPREVQMSHSSPLVLGSRQSSPNPQPDVAGAGGEEILTVLEDSQGTEEQCTCEAQSPDTPCPSCANSPHSWVMVTCKLMRPADLPEKTPLAPKPRKRLGEDARRQTSQTRDIGACVRCKIQRVRCKINSEDPAGPCEGCSRVALNYSRKVLHHIGCHRYKLGEVVLFRTSGSKVTDRWHSAQVRNVMTYGKALPVEMMQEFVGAPFKVRVRKVASTGRSAHRDRTMREWYDGTDILQREAVADYALVDVQETMFRYKDYIHDSVLGIGCRPAVEKVVEGFRKQAGSYGTAIVGEVYQKAWDYFCSLPSADEARDFFYRPWPPKRRRAETSRLISEKGFLLGLFELRFALRHATGWSWVLEEGIPNRTLAEDFTPLRFPPLRGHIGTPRIVVGQIDCIRISCVLRPLANSLLKVLMAWIADGQYNRWMSIFFATFILLCELAKATEDAYHHGWYDKDIKRNGPKNAHVIRDIHESANIILAHWHYFNCSTDPLKFTSEKQESARSKTPLRALTPEQLAVVQQLWLGILQWKQRPHDDELYDNRNTEGWWKKWCHSMYFADQMVDMSWKPRQVFS